MDVLRHFTLIWDFDFSPPEQMRIANAYLVQSILFETTCSPVTAKINFADDSQAGGGAWTLAPPEQMRIVNAYLV